ncbi:retinaldehyde-binding protein 1-like [Dermacentor albipictus]|uniref:retinaldehyde-binding protein 1-like n=1 Tax=Dermacentor albipictus TaxID=60249 RepID=UPI0038FBFA55
MQGTYTKRLANDDVYDTSEGSLPFHLQRIAEDDLGETPTRRKVSLEKLAKLISEEPELNARTDAEFLIRFLRVRKYNVEAAMQTIRNYYYNRSACDSIYREFLPSAVPPSARKLAMVLPGNDRRGRPVFLCNVGAFNPKELTHAVFQRACLMCLELMTSHPSAQTIGMVLIMDCKDFAVESALSLKPGLIQRGLEYVQDCMPSRLKAFHVVRQAHAFDILYSLMKPFLKSKLTRRFKFHGENFESLHEEIAPEELPAQFGGQAPPLDYDAFWSKMDELEAHEMMVFMA